MVAAGARGGGPRRRGGRRVARRARKALGFEELLDGDVEAMKRSTRRYAKRQLTWMRKLPGVHARSTSPGRAPDDVAAELHAACAREA